RRGDAAISQFHLDAVLSATDNPAWSIDLIYGDHFIFGTSGLAAAPGYPIVQVPAGVVFGVPLGISFFGTAFSEPTLIKLAPGYDAATQAHTICQHSGEPRRRRISKAQRSLGLIILSRRRRRRRKSRTTCRLALAFILGLLSGPGGRKPE